MSRVIWSQDGKLALERVYHFLAIRDKGLAKRALGKIYQGAQMLDTQPLLGHSLPGARPPSRELLVRFGRGATFSDTSSRTTMSLFSAFGTQGSYRRSYFS